ncbi:aminotransferase class V-fold PLP-dependent enzyme [Enterococcus viikkiensis]|uniref:aminotransferase class V-fold PLP-dependent enzyme n=1 Tax=Enterococcus viikkiensis TaxID=930854 RepID=UPI0010F7FD61|nr:aminotransferase class V-fold PLP-dependent enzyme [Enterococcus viikkiensis]
MENKYFTEAELQSIRSKFKYVEEDYKGKKRIFLDNAGGSLRLKAAEESFKKIDEMPDASEHTNRVALELLEIEDKGRKDIKEVLFNAQKGVIYPSYTASQIMMELVRVISENSSGTNNVTTILEHPSAFDAMTYYSNKYDRELRVATADVTKGGVNNEAILSLIDENTAILCCMAASNISGYIYDIDTIFTEARKINPDIFIICDAVQHAPHASLDPEKYGIDAMNIAPYKFFGIRGFGVAYISDRIASFEHHRLLGKSKDEWDIGSPAPANFAAISTIIDYVCSLDQAKSETRRKQFEQGMERIANYERFLLHTLLEGTKSATGLRHLAGVKVQMDSPNLEEKDLILSIELDNLDCASVAKELDARGVVAYERSAASMYSKRMIEAFDTESEGVVRISPLHVNTVAEMEQFLKIIAELTTI